MRLAPPMERIPTCGEVDGGVVVSTCMLGMSAANGKDPHMIRLFTQQSDALSAAVVFGVEARMRLRCVCLRDEACRPHGLVHVLQGDEGRDDGRAVACLEGRIRMHWLPRGARVRDESGQLEELRILADRPAQYGAKR